MMKYGIIYLQILCHETTAMPKDSHKIRLYLSHLLEGHNAVGLILALYGCYQWSFIRIATKVCDQVPDNLAIWARASKIER